LSFPGGVNPIPKKQTLNIYPDSLSHIRIANAYVKYMFPRLRQVPGAREWGTIGLAAFKGDWAWRIQAFDLLEFPGSDVVAN
jgi:hypothetical protein